MKMIMIIIIIIIIIMIIIIIVVVVLEWRGTAHVCGRCHAISYSIMWLSAGNRFPISFMFHCISLHESLPPICYISHETTSYTSTLNELLSFSSGCQYTMLECLGLNSWPKQTFYSFKYVLVFYNILSQPRSHKIFYNWKLYLIFDVTEPLCRIGSGPG